MSLTSVIDNLIKEGLATQKYGKTSIENIMNPNTNVLIVSPNSIRNRSIETNNGRDKRKISQRQAILLAESSTNYYSSNMKNFDVKALISVIVKALDNPMTGQRNSLFSAVYDDKNNKMTTTIIRAQILRISSIESMIIAPSYRSVKNYTDKFAKDFQSFLNTKGGSFYGLTKTNLKKSERSSSKDIGNVLQQNKEHLGSEGPRNKIAHVDITLPKAPKKIKLDTKIGLSSLIEVAKNKLTTKGKIVYKYLLETRTSKLRDISGKFKLEAISTFIKEGLFSKVKIPDVFTPTGFIGKAVSTFENFFFRGLKKTERKGFKVKVPTIPKGKDKLEKGSGTFDIPAGIQAKIKESSKVKTEPINNVLEQAFEIDIPDELEESCMFSSQQLIALTGRLNSDIYREVKKHMRLPALVYRTGRFAGSVEINSVTQRKDCSLDITSSYLKNPYAVFNPAISSYRGLSSPQRNPDKIIGDSIRSLAIQVIKKKYKVNVHIT
jgi:hypothetical protein